MIFWGPVVFLAVQYDSTGVRVYFQYTFLKQFNTNVLVKIQRLSRRTYQHKGMLPVMSEENIGAVFRRNKDDNIHKSEALKR